MKDNDLKELEKIVKEQLGIGFEVVSLPITAVQREYGFHLSEKVSVPYMSDSGRNDSKRFNFMVNEVRDLFVDKIKSGRLFTSMVEDHKKEVSAFVKEIEARDHKIEDLIKYKNFYDLHKEIRVEGMAKYTEVNKGIK
jgi:hypothetical protein